MSYLKSVLAAAAVVVLTAGTANALQAAPGPVATDPNFNATPTFSASSYYGMAAWGGSSGSGNMSFIGSTPFLADNQWNNGDPGNGQTKVGFISGSGAYAEQTIGGFTAGHSYTVNVLANSRIGMIALAGLTITYADASQLFSVSATTFNAVTPPASGTVYSAAIPVSNPNPTPTQTGAFKAVTSSAFVATSSNETIRLTNSGGTGSTLLLSAFALTDLGVVPVPEPVSMTLLVTGLLGLGLARRRR